MYVRLFRGADATTDAPPVIGSIAWVDAYGTCQAPAALYLGGDWHDGLLELTVVVPTADGWSNGSRWFGCAISAAQSPGNAKPTDTRSSLKKILSHPGPLKLACVNWEDTKNVINYLIPASCAKRHNGEFAGLFAVSGATYPTRSGLAVQANPGCEAAVARFLGLSGRKVTNPTIGWVWIYNSEDEWNAGNRVIRCYISSFTHDRKFIGSVQGIGRTPAKG